jgi:hypothetical protein
MLGFGPLAAAPLAGSSQRTLPFDDITAGAVVVSSAAFFQTHNLSAVEVVFGTPVVGDAVQTNVNNFTPNNLVLYRPTVEDISVSQDHQLVASSLEATPKVEVGFKWRVQAENTDVWTLH